MTVDPAPPPTRVVDPWQERVERLRRMLPLPLLAASSAVTFVAPHGDGAHAWARFSIGLPLIAVAALMWTVATARPGLINAPAWRYPLYLVHIGLSAVLVWVNPAFGIFAYVGFLYTYVLRGRWRWLGAGSHGLIVAASLDGGYPTGGFGSIVGYILIAAILVILVLNAASITVRAIEQNQERGRMIAELGEANRRLAESMTENAHLHERLVAQARQAGITEERRRLAGEIHDTLAQGLAGIVAQLEAAEHTRRDPAQWSRHLDQARTLARSSLTEARRSVRALRPEQLEDATLVEAVTTMAREWTQRTAIDAEVETTGSAVRAAADVEAAVFRIAQESLSNVAKHAHASAVRITLTYLDDTLLLDVVDNGRGFDPAASTEGYGLLNMRQRLGPLGGRLTLDSTVDVGTTVNATVALTGSTGADR